MQKRAMAKTISGHSMPKSAMAMAIVAIPVVPTLSATYFWMLFCFCLSDFGSVWVKWAERQEPIRYCQSNCSSNVCEKNVYITLNSCGSVDSHLSNVGFDSWWETTDIQVIGGIM